MKNNAKKNTLLLFVLLAVLFSVFSFILSILPSSPHSTIDGGATSQTTTLSITIHSEETDDEVEEDGESHFDEDEINDRITVMTGLTSWWRVNVSLLGKGFPIAWIEAQPNSSQIGNNTIEYFEIKINASTAGGSYKIYFNVTSSQLAGVHPNNISLFIFDTVWTNLTTVVVNGNTNPAQFYGITTHFSKFLIAQKPASSTESSGSSGGSDPGSGSGSPGAGGSSGGGGGGSSSGKKITKPTEPSAEVLEEITEKLPEPVHKPGVLFDVSVNIPEKYRKMLPGETLIGEISLINIKKIGIVPVRIEYLLKDAGENTLFQSYETKVVENEITYLKELELPDDLKPGHYMFFIKVKYEEDIALAGYPFEVAGEEPLFGSAIAMSLQKHLARYNLYWIIGTVLVLILGLIILAIRQRKKRYPNLTFLRRG